MYLYFTRNGTLKEIINDDALRQGDYGVDKMYVFIDNGGETPLLRTDVLSIDARYLLSDNTVVGPIRFTTKTSPMKIPFNAKRDLLFFKYNINYQFFEIDLSEGDSQVEDVIGNTALDEPGLVHCNLSMNLSGGNQKALGDVNFIVEENASLHQNQVASQEYMSLADYLYLVKMANNSVPYTGATSNVNLGDYNLTANKLVVHEHLQIERISSHNYQIGANQSNDYINLVAAMVYYNNKEIATKEWATKLYKHTLTLATYPTIDRLRILYDGTISSNSTTASYASKQFIIITKRQTAYTGTGDFTVDEGIVSIKASIETNTYFDVTKDLTCRKAHYSLLDSSVDGFDLYRFGSAAASGDIVEEL